LRYLTGDRGLRIYHWDSFAPLPFSFDAITWYYRSFLGIFEDPMGLGAPALGAFVLLIGAISMYRVSKKRLSFLLLPLVFALVASGLHRYPFSDRFLLFAVPGLLLVLAKGFQELDRALRSSVPLVGLLLLALLSWQPLQHAVTLLFHPYTVEELRPVLAYVQAHEQPGDVIYVYYGAKPAFDYYSETHKFRASGPVIYGLEGRNDWRIYENDVGRLRGDRRVWMIFSHTWTGGERVYYENNDGVDEQKLFSYDIDAIGHRLDTARAPGAAAYLYDTLDTSPPK
jgi:hypothetical protein